jgi:hypothetical protein
MKDRFLIGLIAVLAAVGGLKLVSRHYAGLEAERHRQAMGAVSTHAVAGSTMPQGDQGSASNLIPRRAIHPPKARAANTFPIARPPMAKRQTTPSKAAEPVSRPALAQQNDPTPEEEDEAEFEPLVPQEVARMALGFVGADADAEEIWVNAINDPNRSPDDRKDLIEDLNEDGFPDPKNITQDDVPLILSRLELIEELAPDAADDVNEAAFEEAYKDLVNMLIKLDREQDIGQ